MNKFKKLAVSFLLAIPMVASAAGMGIYVPFNITETETLDDGYPYYGTTELEYKPAAGLGIAFDSNIGKDKLYNYRLGLEYHKVKLDKVDGQSISGGTYTKNKFNIVNTFGFGVLRTKNVRLWIGPRLNIQFQDADTSYDSTYARDDLGLGIAAAAGLNVNLGKVVSLAVDLDYHAAIISGDEQYYDSLNGWTEYDTITGTNKGLTARFYVLFRFGEQFRKPVEQSVIDNSL